MANLSHTFSVRLSDEARIELESKARIQKRSKADLAREILEDGLRSADKRHLEIVNRQIYSDEVNEANFDQLLRVVGTAIAATFTPISISGGTLEERAEATKKHVIKCAEIGVSIVNLVTEHAAKKSPRNYK